MSEIPNTLEALTTLAIQIDRRLRERRSERSVQQLRPVWMMPGIPDPTHPTPISPASVQPAPLTPTTKAPEPLQLGLVRPSLSPEECLY